MVDQDPERCRLVASELGVPALDDHHKLIGEVDAVSIATPTSSHFEIAKTLLENDVHVLVEKPITTTLEQAAVLVELAEKRGLVLQVGHVERFNPAILALTSLCNEPQFIETYRISPFTQRSTDVDVVLDLMIHDIDLVHSIVGAPVKSLDANGGSVISDVIDIANARIKFENGCVANVTASRASFKTERTLRVFQKNAYISVDMHNKELTMYTKNGDSGSPSQDGISVEKQSFDPSDAMMVQNEAFLESVAGGAPPMVTGRIGMQALETALAIGAVVKNS